MKNTGWKFSSTGKGMFPSPRQPGMPARVCGLKGKLCLFLIAIFLVFTGCDDQRGGKDLADAGLATASTLAAYYDSLAQDTVDIWEMEAFYDSLQGIPFDENSQKLYQDRIDALHHRAQMAADLGSIYNALAQLSTYDAQGQVGEAAQRLSKGLTSIPILPGSNVDPSKLVGSVAGDLANWQQSRDIRKGSRLIEATLGRMEQLFQGESRLYKSIAKDRALTVANVIEYMIENKMVTTTPLLQKVPQVLGLTLTSVPGDERTTKALIQVARARLQRLAIVSGGAADSTDQALLLLIRNHKDFQGKKQLSLGQVMAGLQRAQTYLDELSQLKSQKQ